MAWYAIGTVSIVNNSNVVNGVGTTFVVNARNGDALLAPDGNWYEITNIVSDTQLAISPSYLGSTVTAANFRIAPLQGYVKSSADLLRTVTNDIANRLAAIDNLDAAELSALNGITSNIQAQLDTKFTGNPSYLADRTNHTGVQAIDTVTGLQSALDGKQPKTTILDNTTASFTAALKTKLDGVDSRSNHTGTQAINTIDGLDTALNSKQAHSTILDNTTASFTTTLKTKLDGVDDRANHTGTQAIATVDGLSTALAGKQETLVSGTNIKTINGNSILSGGDITISGDVVLNGIQTLNGKSGATVNLVPADIGAATAAQGAKADTAVQPADLAVLATDAELATAIATRATAAQGTKADSALQSSDLPNDPYIKKLRMLALGAM